jgi:hypothetical protein
VIYDVPMAAAVAAVLSYRAIQLPVPLVLGELSISGRRTMLTSDGARASTPPAEHSGGETRKGRAGGCGCYVNRWTVGAV